MLDVYVNISPQYTGFGDDKEVSSQVYIGQAIIVQEDVLKNTVGSLHRRNHHQQTLGQKQYSLSSHIPHEVGKMNSMNTLLDEIVSLEAAFHKHSERSGNTISNSSSLPSSSASLLPTFLNNFNQKHAEPAFHLSLDVRFSKSKSKLPKTMNAAVYGIGPQVYSSNLYDQNEHKSNDSETDEESVRSITFRSTRPALLAASHAALTRSIRESFNNQIIDGQHAHALQGDICVDRRDDSTSDFDKFRDSDVYSTPTDVQRLFSRCSQLLHAHQADSDEIDYNDGNANRLNGMNDPQEVLEKLWEIYCKLREI